MPANFWRPKKSFAFFRVDLIGLHDCTFGIALQDLLFLLPFLSGFSLEVFISGVFFNPCLFFSDP